MQSLKMIIERCCTDVESVRDAARKGAARVELCDRLEVGGITPDESVIREAVSVGIPVNVLVRPRGGDFIYNEHEILRMLESIYVCHRCGVNGVVIGALLPDGNVDIPTMRRLLSASGPMQVTFHRAFDECSDPFRALEEIIALGCDRLLTSGQKPTANEGVALIRQLVERADGRIIIMPGSGITPANLHTVSDMTGASEFHGTRIP